MLKKMVEEHNSLWVNELLDILWVYHTTAKTATGETTFALTYRSEAVSSIEIEAKFF